VERDARCMYELIDYVGIERLTPWGHASEGHPVTHLSDTPPELFLWPTSY
jgi:hypothetical protein